MNQYKNIAINFLIVVVFSAIGVIAADFLFALYEEKVLLSQTTEGNEIDLKAFNYNDSSVAKAKSDKEFRVLSFGDSFGYSIMQYDYSYSGVIARKLNEEIEGLEIRVVNLGEPATTLYHYMAAYKYWSKFIEHDAAIFNIYLGNDLLDIVFKYSVQPWKPVQAYSDQDTYVSDGTKKSFVPKVFPLRMMDYAYAYYLTFTASQKPANKIKLPPHYNLASRDNLTEDKFLETNMIQLVNSDFSKINSLTEGFNAVYEFMAFASSLRQKGIKVLISLAPNQVQVEDDLKAKVSKKYFLDMEKFDFTLPGRVVMEIKDRVDPGIIAVDLFDPFRCLTKKGGNYYYKTNTHWNLEGNDLAGEVIAAEISRNWFGHAAELSESLKQCAEEAPTIISKKTNIEQIQGYVASLGVGKERRPDDQYEIINWVDGQFLVSSNGSSIEVIPQTNHSYLEEVNIGHSAVTFSGWTIDRENSSVPESLLIFSNGKLIYKGQPIVPRPDVTDHFKDPALLYSGFTFDVSKNLTGNLSDAHIQLFAVQGNVASELIYPENYPMGKSFSPPLKVQPRKDVYKIALNKNGEENLILPSKASVPIVVNEGKKVRSLVEKTKEESDRVVFSGFAADLENKQAPKAILVFINDKFIYSGTVKLQRPDVAEFLKTSNLKKSGFHYEFPISLFKNINSDKVRFFVLTEKESVSEFWYPPEYPFK